MSYGHPQYNIQREHWEPNVTGIASTSVRKMLAFQACKLLQVKAQVVTAGTDTGAGFDIYVGTASVGALACGTQTAGSIVSSGALNVDVPQNGLIELKGKAASATLVASFNVLTQVLATSTQAA